MARYDDILQVVGRTPVVRMDRVGGELACELWGKCEYLNPGGSLKDRAAVHMLLEAERQGRIEPGDTLIEPTSGNTGIGLAMAAAARGYRMIICMPERMSQEKEIVMRSLGAEIVRTPTEAAWDAPESYISVAHRMARELPNAHVLDQYSNQDNPGAHYQFTAGEILEDFGDELQMVVIGVGTGGTATGVARRLKESIPGLKVIGVDPEGSVLAEDGGNDQGGGFEVEGLGYDFLPDVLDNRLIDRYVKVADRDTFRTARRVIREEGLLVGGSSGSIVWGALQAARELGPDERCLVILPDSVRNYLTKFLSDDWMRERGYLDEGEAPSSSA